jgi:fyn-related kinase
MCDNGSLLSLLKDRKLKGKSAGKPPFTVAERIKFGIDTAKGMAHLTANAFVHRDLAARNILVDATMTCKVADFGLARGIAGARAGPGTNEDGDEEEYYRSRTGTFPVRWTSPEAMQTMRFSEASDCWSFGITLVEVFTDGGKPYAGMANAAVISQVQGGYRAPQPKLCADAVYTIMLQCWSAKAVDRPTFATLVAKLEGIDSSDAVTSPGASATLTAAPPRQAVAVNDTYMTDEPAAAGAGNDDSAEDAADDEYLSVAAGVAHGAAQNDLEDGFSEDSDGGIDL